MTIEKDFWKHKKLTEMSLEEWEALCDGCSICCLYKIEDEISGKVRLTNVVCRFLDLDTCTCQLYDSRISAMPTCIKLTPSKVKNLDWLPDTCAYRLIMEGKPLPSWHPLVSGDRNSVHKAGVSIKGKVVSETSINMEHLEDYIIEDLTEIEKTD